MRFTDIALRALKPPVSGQKDYWDDTLDRFGLRVSQGGAKTFILLQNGNRRSLGRFPHITLAEARQAAHRLLAEERLGRTFTQTTFKEALEHYIEQHVKKNLKASTAYEAERVLRRHFDFGTRRLDSLKSPEIMRIVDRLSPSAGNHAFAYARGFFRWCVRRRYIDRHPLENLALPNKTRARERVLKDEELAVIWTTAKRFRFPLGCIVMLLIVTGQRVGETSALCWDYIDLDACTITFPAGIVKNKTIHILPISNLTRTIIEGISGEGDRSGLLFPSIDGTKPYDGHNKSKGKLQEACNATWAQREHDKETEMQHWTLHDLRRTFATIHARIGTPPHVTEALLNHKTGTRSPIQRIYDRHTYLPEMRAAMSNYDRYLTDLFSKV